MAYGRVDGLSNGVTALDKSKAGCSPRAANQVLRYDTRAFEFLLRSLRSANCNSTKLTITIQMRAAV